MTAPPNGSKFVLDLSHVDLAPAPDPEVARAWALVNEAQEAQQVKTGVDPDYEPPANSDLRTDEQAEAMVERLLEVWARSKADAERRNAEHEAEEERRRIEAERLRPERERAAAEARVNRATRLASIDRQPFIDALRVVALDPLIHPRRSERDALIRAVGAGGDQSWFNVSILCPHCKAPRSSLGQSDRDGSLRANCGGRRVDGEVIECAHPEQIVALVEALVEEAAAALLLDADEDDDRSLPPMPEIVNLAALLAESDDEAPSQIIRDVWPRSGRIVCSGPAKSGKTTLRNNVVRSLVDGVPFLGEFAVEQTFERVVILDLELTRDMQKDWLRRQGFVHPESVDVIPMRGQGAALDLSDPRKARWWIERLSGADALVADCLDPILNALGIDVMTGARRWLDRLDEVLNAAGVPNSLVLHHHGNSGKRPKGDSGIQGWPDALWDTFLSEPDQPNSPRFFRVYGRDVGVDEGLLDFDPTTGALTYESSGGSRADAQVAAKRESKAAKALRVVQILAADHARQAAAGEVQPRWRAGKVTALGERETGWSRDTITAARNLAVTDGWLTEETGASNTKSYRLTSTGLAVVAGGN